MILLPWRRSFSGLIAGLLVSIKLVARGVQCIKYTIRRSCGWINPIGVPVYVTQQTTIVCTSPMVVKKHLDKLANSTRHTSSARKQLENLLDADFELDEFKPPNAVAKNVTNVPKNTVGKRMSYKHGESIQLDYDTKKRPFRTVGEDECPIPNFSNIWNAIVEMRKEKNAPVDTMGAHCLANKGAAPEVYEYQTLIACMLSSQTKDETTAAAMDALKQHGLDIETISKMPEGKLDSLISKVGFHSTKAKHIKQTTEILKTQFGGRVPQTLEELTSLPGVGPKMANLVLQLAFNRIHGIAVDVHVHRIANRLGWVKTKNPEETRLKLEQLLPKRLWAEVNHLLVGFGQTICTAAGPGCATCAANKWCPTGISNLARHTSK